MNTTQSKVIAGIFILVVGLALGEIWMQSKGTKAEMTVTKLVCGANVEERYAKAATQYAPIREEHMSMFNVRTGIAEESATQLGECAEGKSTTRFLVQEEGGDETLTHYVGYVVVGDTDESFSFHKCQGENECEVTQWCPVPQFGPSSCGENGECSGDNGFRGCLMEDSPAQ